MKKSKLKKQIKKLQKESAAQRAYIDTMQLYYDDVVAEKDKLTRAVGVLDDLIGRMRSDLIGANEQIEEQSLTIRHTESELMRADEKHEAARMVISAYQNYTATIA